MSAIPMSCASVPWQKQFLTVLPAIKTHAQIQFRSQHAERREESVQAAVAAACASFQLLASQGKLDGIRPSAIADFAVRQVRSCRRVGGRQSSTDVLSELTHKKHGLQVQSLQDQELWQAAALEAKHVSPCDLAAFRLDFAQWLRSFSKRHQRIITALAGGEQTKTVAELFGLTPGRVSQLRRIYENAWRVFQGEAAAVKAG